VLDRLGLAANRGDDRGGHHVLLGLIAVRR
jgi:hypothetical protein